MKFLKDCIDYIRHRSAVSLQILTGMALVGAMASCADDLEVRQALPDPAEDGTLFIMIPNVEAAAEYGASRADEYQNTRAFEDADEGKINDLWFFAYPVDASGSPLADQSGRIVTQLTDPDPAASDIYKDYNVYKVDNFKDGNYHIYVLANVEDYLANGISFSNATAESVVENLVLNVGTATGTKYFTNTKLPMGCLPTEVHDKAGVKDATNGVFNFTRGTRTEVYADLTFLCAKIRYTVLYDQGSFSSQFSASADPDFTEATVKNVRSQYAWHKGTASADKFDNSSLFAREHTRTVYPDDEGSKYLTGFKSKDDYEEDLTEKNGEWNGAIKRSWQGTVYVSPNDKTGDSDRTYLSLKTNGNSIESSYSFDPISKEKTIERGSFYDLVAKLETPNSQTLNFVVNVHDWDAKNLALRLHGPYELVVETTKITVSSQEPGKLWYRSDVGPADIRFAYPLITYTDEDNAIKTSGFYVATVMKDAKGNYELNDNGDYQIEVKVNPAIPFSVLQNVNASSNGYNKSDYMYFEIIAGNIQKKIEVNPLNLKAVLEVNPKNITIDVREYITSGLKESFIDILVETNVTNSLSISNVSNFGSLTPGTGNTGELTLKAGDGTKSLSASAFTITDGSGNIRVDLKKLFEASTYWQTEQTIKFKITASKSGTSLSEEVSITIKPYSTNYTIYFRPIGDNWSHPHIYVYQCLEAPADTDVKDSSGNSIAGKTIGYYSGDNATAALEYAFTNNISFKGWSGYGGTVAITGGQTTSDGFYKMGGSIENSVFNPSEGNENYYNFYTDLNSAHIDRKSYWAYCSDCNGFSKDNIESFNKKDGKLGKHLFGGVVMEKVTVDGEQWYKYTLSGIATPGKAMIMFNNDHTDGSGDGYRYPKHGEVGVPLFDFPDNEGWFLFDGNSARHDLNFSDNKPNIDDIRVKYRLYVPNTHNNGTLYGVYIFGDFSDALALSGSNHPNNWDSSKNDTKVSDVSGYRVVEFYRLTSSGSMKYKWSNPECGTGTDHDHDGGTTNGNFSLIDGYWTGYIASEGSKVSKGKPTAIAASTYGPDDVDWYIQGLSSWNTSDPTYKFTKYANNEWHTQTFSVPANTEYKIGGAGGDWSKVDYGSNTDAYVLNVGSTYTLNKDYKNNFKTPSSGFTGYAKITFNGTNYVLSWVQTGAPKTAFANGDKIIIKWSTNIHADGNGTGYATYIWIWDDNLSNKTNDVDWPGKEGIPSGSYRTWTVTYTGNSANANTVIEYLLLDSKGNKVKYNGYGDNWGFKFADTTYSTSDGAYVLTINDYSDLKHY